MKTLEILYQAFRVRYSLNQLQQLLDRGCRVALLGPGDAVDILKGYLGDPVTTIGGGDPAEDLIELSWELTEEEQTELRTCDACLILFPEGPPEVDELSELAEKIPIHVKSLWICLTEHEKGGVYHENDLTLPTIQALSKQKAKKRFLKLLFLRLPQIVIILARNWTDVRSTYCKTLTRRTALRNGIRSSISSLPLRNLPVVGPVLSMLATSAELMLLTSSQLRLSFVIAAAHNRPLDFFDRISELWPIIGSAFGFRGASRFLVKRLPKVGPALRPVIAFGGTYAIGEASRLYYEHGRPTSDEVRRELVRRAHEDGAKEAQRLLRRVLAGQSLEEIEDEEDGDEVLEAVEKLTQAREQESTEKEEALEPTVEMEAIEVEEESEPKKEPEKKPEPTESSKKEKPPESKPSKKAEKAKETSSKSSSSKSEKKGGSKKSKSSSKKKNRGKKSSKKKKDD